MASEESSREESTTLTCILTVGCCDGEIHMFASSTMEDILNGIVLNYPPLQTNKSMGHFLRDVKYMCVESAAEADDSTVTGDLAHTAQQENVQKHSEEFLEHELCTSEAESEEISLSSKNQTGSEQRVKDVTVQAAVIDSDGTNETVTVVQTKSRRISRPTRYYSSDFVNDTIKPDPVPDIKCSYCDQEFRSQYFLNKHKCADEEKAVLRESHLASIESNGRKNNIWIPRECQNCREIYHSNIDYKRHVGNCNTIVCKYCTGVFNSRHSVRIHVTTDHIVGTPITCKHCGEKAGGILELDEHFRVCPTIITKYSCTVCGESCVSSSLLYKHMKSHLDNRCFTCDLCGLEFTTNGNLKRHFRVHAQEPLNKVISDMGGELKSQFEMEFGEEDLKCMFVDDDDGNDDDDRGSKNVSDETVSDTTTGTVDQCDDNPEGGTEMRRRVTCVLCNNDFASVDELRVHVTSHSNKRPFACTQCRRSFLRSAELVCHTLEHCGDRPHECHICQKRFPKSSTLRAHLVTHEEVKPYECKLCGRTLSTLIQLECHMARHTGLKPFKCDQCDKAFGHKSALHVHKVAHADKKRFQCNACGKMFARSTQLARHIKVHTGERDVPCPTCSRLFPTRDNLRKHLMTHNRQRPRLYQCNACHKSFYTNSHLRQHQRTLTCKAACP